MHALVQSLFALVPPEGSSWPRQSRERWLTALGAVLDLVYEEEALGPPTSAPVVSVTTQNRPSPFVDGPRPDDPGSRPRTADAGSAAPVEFGHPTAVIDIRAERQGVGRHRAKDVRQQP